MNVYHNSWPEEQQHMQRQQDLIREADHRRLVRLVNGDQVRSERGSRFQWAWLGNLRCRLSTAFEHLTSRIRPVPRAAMPSDCP